MEYTPGPWEVAPDPENDDSFLIEETNEGDWAAFAPLATRAATPLSAICLPNRPPGVRIPSPARVPRRTHRLVLLGLLAWSRWGGS
jgi:hypothetical protein